MNKKLLLFGVMMLSLCCIACNDDDKGKDDTVLSKDTNTEEIDNFVSSLKEPKQIYLTPAEEQEREVTETDICAVTEKTVTKEFDESVILDPTSDVIYPGALIDGNSIVTGEYKPLLGCERAPLTISTDFANTTSSSATTIESPTLSSVRDGIKQCIANANISGSTSARISWEITEVQSEEELSIAIGATASVSKITSISNQFNWKNPMIKSWFLLKFVQAYYTVDVDFPLSPSGWFKEGTSLSDFKKALEDTPSMPCFVSSVTYGRTAYVAIHSSCNAKEVSDALKTVLTAGATSAEIAANIESNKMLNESNITGIIIEESASDAYSVINNLSGFLNFLKNGGDYSASSPGAMISYKLRKLSDNTIFRVVSAGTYYLRNCEARFGQIAIESQKLYCNSEYATAIGNISISVTNPTYSTDAIFVHKASGQKLTASQSETINTKESFKVDNSSDPTIWFHFELKSSNSTDQKDRYFVQWNGKDIRTVADNGHSEDGMSVAIQLSQLESTPQLVRITSTGYAIQLKTATGQELSYYFSIAPTE